MVVTLTFVLPSPSHSKLKIPGVLLIAQPLQGSQGGQVDVLFQAGTFWLLSPTKVWPLQSASTSGQSSQTDTCS